jgi:hypothetical protein
MRFFLRSRIPAPGRVLLVESGSRAVLEKAWERMRAIFPGARYDLCTCFAGEPQPGGLECVFRVTGAARAGGKRKMLLAVCRRRPAIAALLFTGEPILLRWKLALLLLLPSKVLVVNENGDFFWLDWSNRRVMAQFLASRAGLNGFRLLRSTCRALVFPFVLLFLLVNALVAYTRRWLRLLAWRFGRRSARS